MAIEAGYRHLDTAFVYMNEAAIGHSLKQIFQSGKVTREEMFIVTKVRRNKVLKTTLSNNKSMTVSNA